MRFLSLFSGIEAATCAWSPLGWECAGVAEVEPFPCAVLKHHYPEVPNLGDVTKITADQINALGHIDLVCGGFPCQDLSVSGKRKGLNNADGSTTRSGLFFDAMRIADWANPRWLFIENVPGMFSSNGGRDFAAVVGEMAGCEFSVPRDGWRNAGVAVGPKGLVEWSVMDAQYHGLAQRRKRVFIVRDSGDWANRPPIFLEPYRMQGHPAPSRKAGQKVAPTIRAGAANGGPGHGARSGDSKDELIVPVLHAFGGNKTSGDRDVSTALTALTALTAHGGTGRHDFESETFITHSLRGEGFDASEDGTGRGTPLIPVCFDTTQITSAANFSNPKAGDPCHPLAASAHVPCIAFPERMSGTQCASTEDLAPSMGAANPTAVAVSLRGRDGGATAELGDEVGNCLRASGGGGDKAHVLAPAYTTKLHNTTSNQAGKLYEEYTVGLDRNSPPPALITQYQVRRLTPKECARLQGFPDTFLDIPMRGKPAADGPKYRALGNSWAVPVARWIGQRLEQVNNIRSQNQTPISRCVEVHKPPSLVTDVLEHAPLES